MSQFRIGAQHRSFTDREQLVLYAEAMAALVEELSERVHPLRDELWRLRAELAQQGR
jgi:uncharacterized small protein (DUF1192 family)